MDPNISIVICSMMCCDPARSPGLHGPYLSAHIGAVLGRKYTILVTSTTAYTHSSEDPDPRVINSNVIYFVNAAKTANKSSSLERLHFIGTKVPFHYCTVLRGI